MMSAMIQRQHRRCRGGRHGVKGFTLVELLIVLALSSVLTAALFQVFQGNKQNVELLDAFSKVQEAGRYTMDYLGRDLRMAGYLGCVNAGLASGKITNLLDTADAQYNPLQHRFNPAIMAIDSYDPANPAHVAALPGLVPLAGTDVFSSSSALSTDLLVRTAHSSTSANLEVTGPDNQVSVLREGMVLMVTDCNTAHIFSVSKTEDNAGKKIAQHNKAVTNGPDNRQVGLGVNYAAGSQVLVMNTTTFFVAPSALVQGQNSLYRLNTLDGNVAQELVPYVEDMQLLYGVDTDSNGAPDVYKTAQEIADDGDDMADDVYSVNIELVVAGNADVNSAPLAGFENDGKLRKRYSRVVNIRNAGIASF